MLFWNSSAGDIYLRRALKKRVQHHIIKNVMTVQTLWANAAYPWALRISVLLSLHTRFRAFYPQRPAQYLPPPSLMNHICMTSHYHSHFGAFRPMLLSPNRHIECLKVRAFRMGTHGRENAMNTSPVVVFEFGPPCICRRHASWMVGKAMPRPYKKIFQWNQRMITFFTCACTKTLPGILWTNDRIINCGLSMELHEKSQQLP
jgi:hypothetical protein